MMLIGPVQMGQLHASWHVNILKSQRELLRHRRTCAGDQFTSFDCTSPAHRV